VQYRAETEPNEPAFTYLANGVDDEIVMTNADLDQRARRIAAWLQSRNMFGQRVLLLYPPGLGFIASYFGCLYAGAIAVPVYPPRRNRSILRIESVAYSAQATVALTTEDVIKTVDGMLNEAPSLKHITWLATSTLEENLEDQWSFPSIHSETIAFLQYTSGSTGTPKGVILTHGNLLHNSQMIHQGFEHTRTGRGVFWLPSYHDMGLIGGIIQPLYCGRPNVIMSPLSFLQKPFRWLAAITRYKGTTSGGPNFAYDLCVRNITEAQVDELDLRSWTVAFNGAEPVLAETMEAFARKFERCGFRYEAFYPCFGLAEGTLIVSGGYVKNRPIVRSLDPKELSIGRAVEVRDSRSSKVVRYVSSGRKILPDERIAIVDPETCVECPDSIVGEIWVKSPSNAKGYWDSPEATERTFQAKIAETDEGPFMRTGDLGFIMDGELFVTGRIKDLIIVRGVNVYPQDIELTVQKTNPHLRPLGGAAFMVRDDSELPQEHLIIVQELDRQFKGETNEVYAAIQKAVALEHEIPVKGIVLIKSGSIPKTSSGKIQHHACRNGFLDGSLSEVERWVSGDVSFRYVQGGDAENALEEAVGITDSEDHSRLVRGKIEYAAEGPVRPIMPEDSPEKPSHMLIKETPAKPPAQSTLSVISKEEIADIVLEEVRKIAKERAAHLTIESDITELGLDSLERMEILASLEDRFGGQFPESVLPELHTAQQVLDAVLIYLGTGPRKPSEQNRSRSQADIPEEDYNVAKFPEYLRLKVGLDLMRDHNMNRFFDVHEGISQDRTTMGGKEYINFSSYNYIAASGDPAVIKAAVEACEKYGTSVSASRLVSGNKPINSDLEREIAQFLGCEDAMVLSAGHSTNDCVIGHLMDEKDMVLFDSLAHNSIVLGALHSCARRRPFPHNDWEAADWIMKKYRGEYRRVLIAIEGVYSMDGDFPDLPKFIEVKKRHRAMMLVDEAHSLGVMGATGRGIGEHFNVDRQDVDIWMSSLSKTLGSCGGYVSGRKELIEYLKYTVPFMIFSAGISPPNCAAALAALRLLVNEPQRVIKLRQNGKLFLDLVKAQGFNTGTSYGTSVVPIILGNSILALKMSKGMLDHGVNVQPILHPAVEEKAARLRFFITSAHSEEQLRYTANALAETWKAESQS
jgi:7-keto-8-aminopelargonate synthetase-like enzyme/acyl-CoA synthetase (AMP-forming)/AMP-acid ligase II/acyl carrier protein